MVSVVGWGTDPKDGMYWLVRNSWGEYWGEMGYVRVAKGALNLEDQCAWAVPGHFTSAEGQNQAGLVRLKDIFSTFDLMLLVISGALP